MDLLQLYESDESSAPDATEAAGEESLHSATPQQDVIVDSTERNHENNSKGLITDGILKRDTIRFNSSKCKNDYIRNTYDDNNNYNNDRNESNDNNITIEACHSKKRKACHIQERQEPNCAIQITTVITNDNNIKNNNEDDEKEQLNTALFITPQQHAFKSSTLILNQQYLLHTYSKYTSISHHHQQQQQHHHTDNISKIKELLLLSSNNCGCNKSSSRSTSKNALLSSSSSSSSSSSFITNTVLKMLLDAMEYNKFMKIVTKKKPIQTTSSIRDFIMNVIDHHTATATCNGSTSPSTSTLCIVLHDISCAFRLACHYVVMASVNKKIHGKNENIHRHKQKKTFEFMTHSLLTLFICLRGFVCHLSKKAISIMDEIITIDDRGQCCDSKTAHCEVLKTIQTFFIGNNDDDNDLDNNNGSRSCEKSFPPPLLHLLLDIVPLLTDMDDVHIHGTLALGPKKCKGLFQNLVKLEQSLMMFYQTNDTNELSLVLHGMMELFMRQLLQQENDKKQLIKELEHYQTKSPSSGIVSSILAPVPSSSCQMVIRKIVTMREKKCQYRDDELRLPQSITEQRDQKVAKVTPGSICNSSLDSMNTHDAMEDQLMSASTGHNSTSNMNDQVIKKKKYDVMRIDGCMYLSKILRLLKPISCILATPSNHELEVIQKQRSYLAYYLFHLLWNNDPFEDYFHAKSLQRSCNLKSAALACLNLAGKMIDKPLSIRRILIFASKISFLDEKFFSQVVHVPIQNSKLSEYAEPKQSLMKDYESHLMMVGFGCVSPNYHDLSLEAVIHHMQPRLLCDNETVQQMMNVLYSDGFTHSPLSLVEDKEVVALSLYHLSCHLSNVPLKSTLSTNFTIEERNLGLTLYSFMITTLSFIEQRKNQIEDLRIAGNTPFHDSIIYHENIDAPDFESVLESINSI